VHKLKHSIGVSIVEGYNSKTQNTVN